MTKKEKKMSINVIIGAQWGDEGKGKHGDIISEKADYMVRFQGGANAGHTLVIDGEKIIMHLLPVGIMRPSVVNLVGPYVLMDLEVLEEELAIAKKCGAKIILDSSAPVVLPIHKQIDRGREKLAGKSAIGTTQRGIGPTYEDFWSRRFVKLGDLVSKERFSKALLQSGYLQEKTAQVKFLRENPWSHKKLLEWGDKFYDLIKPFLGDTRAIVAKAIAEKKNILFEGAQGVMLDALHGAHPYCTSSFCTLAAVNASFGVYNFDRVIGIAKAYVTRVGAGPFPTKLDNSIGENIRTVGAEFGATTGRPRDCGWLDLVALKYACRMGGVTELQITKLDVMTGLKEIKVCVGYEDVDEYASLTLDVLENAKPVYNVFPVWEDDISKVSEYDKLPPEAKEYLAFLENFLGVRISAVGVGPDRKQILYC